MENLIFRFVLVGQTIAGLTNLGKWELKGQRGYFDGDDL